MSATPQSLGRPLHLALVACTRCGAWDCPGKWIEKQCAAGPRSTEEAA